MTFYWWSHWFWITILTHLLLITVVRTYPSQEISASSSRELNHQTVKPQKSITRLYQQTDATVSRVTEGPTSKHFESVTAERTRLQSVMTQAPPVKETTDYEEELLKDSIATQYEDEEFQLNEGTENSEDFEVKRSVDNNSTNLVSQQATSFANKSLNSLGQSEDGIKSKRDDKLLLNNFTNYTKTPNTPSTNVSNSENSTVATLTDPDTTIASVGTNKSQVASTVGTESETHASPLIAGTHVDGQELKILGDDKDDLALQRAPFTLENAHKEEDLIYAESEQRSRKSKVLAGDYQEISSLLQYPMDAKNLLTRSASTAPNEFDGVRRRIGDDGNISTEALAIKRTYFLDAGAISAICFTIFGVCCTIGTLGIVLYRRRYLNKPQTLSEPDSSVYIDDSTMRDNSDEMYSLDNDSFLNSLEAMTIQNYWTDTVKHTKL